MVKDVLITQLKTIPEYYKYHQRPEGKKWDRFLNYVAEYGILDPIIVSEDNTVIFGYDSLLACMELDILKIPVNVVHCYSEKDKLKRFLELTMYLKRQTYGKNSTKTDRCREKLKELKKY